MNYTAVAAASGGERSAVDQPPDAGRLPAETMAYSALTALFVCGIPLFLLQCWIMP